MIKVEAVNVMRVRGNAEKIISEEKITGELEFLPTTDGSGSLMFPISFLIAENEFHRKQGIMEIQPLSKMDLRLREILHLSKRETWKLLSLDIGESMILTRGGWGKVWKHVIKRI